MERLEHITSLGEYIQSLHHVNASIAFVPTMGNLHEGHLSLVQKAKTLADKVVVSIYVNPLQFGKNEDFSQYPRTLDADVNALLEEGVDALFLPSNEMIYPRKPENTTFVEVPGLSNILCGEFRPDHFRGVATVVCKLLNLVRPDFLLLGEKDFQQVMVIRRMVEDLNMSVSIVSGETVREADGLAKSSRNQYLDAVSREKAPLLYQTLQQAVDRFWQGDPLADIEAFAQQYLNNNGFRCQYFEFRDARTLEKPNSLSLLLVLVAAAYLGNTRLIDNIQISRNPEV